LVSSAYSKQLSITGQTEQTALAFSTDLSSALSVEGKKSLFG